VPELVGEARRILATTKVLGGEDSRAPLDHLEGSHNDNGAASPPPRICFGYRKPQYERPVSCSSQRAVSW
jgi:hypothetical protein